MHRPIVLLASGMAALAQVNPPAPWIFESGGSRLEVRLEGFRATLENGDVLIGGYRRDTVLRKRSAASGETKAHLGRSLWRPLILPGSESHRRLAELAGLASARVAQAQGTQPSPSEALLIKHVLHLAGELGKRATPPEERAPVDRPEPASAEAKAPAKASRLPTPQEWAAILSKVAKASASGPLAPKAAEPAQGALAAPASSSEAAAATGSADTRPASRNAVEPAPHAPASPAATGKAWTAVFKGGLIQALVTGYDCRFADGSILVGGAGRLPVLIVKSGQAKPQPIRDPRHLQAEMRSEARAAAIREMEAWAMAQAAWGYTRTATAEDRLRARNLEAFVKDVKASF